MSNRFDVEVGQFYVYTDDYARASGHSLHTQKSIWYVKDVSDDPHEDKVFVFCVSFGHAWSTARFIHDYMRRVA